MIPHTCNPSILLKRQKQEDHKFKARPCLNDTYTEFVKIKSFCASENIIKRVKRLPTKWGKIICIPNHVSDKVLKIQRVYEELQLNNKNPSPLKNGQKTRIGTNRKNIFKWLVSIKKMFNIVYYWMSGSLNHRFCFFN